VSGWKPVAATTPEITPTHDLGRNLWCWILGCVMIYCALFGVGKILLLHYGIGSVLVIISALCAWFLAKELSQPMEFVSE
jgi:branched-subunit amino acid transport protein AzlD